MSTYTDIQALRRKAGQLNCDAGIFETAVREEAERRRDADDLQDTVQNVLEGRLTSQEDEVLVFEAAQAIITRIEQGKPIHLHSPIT